MEITAMITELHPWDAYYGDSFILHKKCIIHDVMPANVKGWFASHQPVCYVKDGIIYSRRLLYAFKFVPLGLNDNIRIL